jgi:hypothetical protein
MEELKKPYFSGSKARENTLPGKDSGKKGL